MFFEGEFLIVITRFFFYNKNFISKIDLSYCEKKCSSDKEKPLKTANSLEIFGDHFGTVNVCFINFLKLVIGGSNQS